MYEPGVASSSRGLVGDTVFAVLPNVVPIHAFALTVLCQVVSSDTQVVEPVRICLLSSVMLDLSCQTVENPDV